ncbi:Hsp70 family protein [Actinoplanes sp. NBC_00393]|uniref:Hsp70 family protein n=1 Tax=Actinoplanes sp. NBC_00393 TaxID=2975953 RepID=UPI002E1DBE8B
MSIDQGGPKRYALGIDFGTSNTVAVARWPDGRARPILVDGSPLLPSAVYADASGNLLVGRDAVHSARLDPARFEPNPKRRIDDGLVLLGEREFEAVELITAVLARVTEEWHRAVGPYRPQTTLTCPASWGATRRTLLAEAAARAGLEGARLVAEPVAAATYFAEILGRDVPIGSVVMVHDFGAGTFDASVVARTAEGFEVLAVDGRDDLGGLDVDAAIVEYLRTDDWRRLMEPGTVEERRARRQLWDDVRIAKERLSRAQSADFVVPLLDTEAHLTRDELETLARPVLEQTVRVTKNLLRWADLPEGRLAGVFLVGGASRIPLVATLLHRELGDPPVVIEQPELVVAEGSILAGAALLSSEPAAPGPTEELRLPSKYLPSATGLIAVQTKPLAPSPSSSSSPESLSSESPLQESDETVVARAGEPVVEAEQATVVAAVSEPGTSRREIDAAPTLATERLGPPEPEQAPESTPLPKRVKQPVAEAPDDDLPPDDDMPPHLRPPVDPWPHADPSTWRPDPDATAAAPHPRGDWKPDSSWKPVPPPRKAGPPHRANRPTTPVVAHARPISPVAAQPHQIPHVVGSARAVPQGRAVAAAPRPPQLPEPKPKKRRRGGFLRAVQILLSLLTMVLVPIVALVLAYGYANGDPLQEDAINVFEDLGNLLGFN